MIVHRLAWTVLICVIVLVAVGAIVRVTGSGLGCPDWPTCWGCLIPPTSADQIDVEKLDLEKFKRHAERKGIDPDTITRETILESFNPVHTWIEFTNRLTSLPLGISALLLAIFSITYPRPQNRKWIIGLAWFSLFDVLFNAVMGAMVVRSGLQPGIITLHMALAFLLIIVLVSIVWLSRPEQDSQNAKGKPQMELPVVSKRLLIVSLIFFACLFIEGLMGSQLREQTDELQRDAAGVPRDQWIGQLASTSIFKIHRTFSWTLFFTALMIFAWSRRVKGAKEPALILVLVLLMMLMGVILGHLAIYQVVQVLHVVTTAILLAITWHWVTRLFSYRRSSTV